MELRPYQMKAVRSILENWEQGVQKTLLILPTGTGKTIVFSKVIAERVSAGGRVLVLAHREELLNQASDKLYRSTGLMSSVEKADRTSLNEWYNVTVGSVQTLQNPKRLEQFKPDHFDTIVVDEAHHAVSPSYRRVLDYFSDAKVLGVTATADRGDKQNLGVLFDTVAYEYSLPAAIKEGYLVPIKALTVPIQIDLSGVKVSAGDYQAAALGTALDPYLESIADSMLTYCRDRKTVVFLPLIATSQKFAAMLNKRGMKTAEVNGESTDRADIISSFSRGEYQVLCNSMLLTEGWDEPTVDCIVCLRPTKVRALYAQIVGRGTRPCPGKKDLLLLDFLWHTERHDLCRPASLVCRNSDLAPRVAELMAENPSGEAVDLLEAEESAENSAQEEREETVRKMIEENSKNKWKLVDPIQYEMSITGKCTEYEPDTNNLNEYAPPSSAQLALLEKYGIYSDEIKCSGHASKLIETIQKRRTEGLSTPKQIRCLERVGFVNVGQWKLEEAANMINRLHVCEWRIPYTFDKKSYKPESLRK